MLARWEPFGGLRRRGGNLFNELNDIQREMNRLFDDFFGERQSGLAEGAWMPALWTCRKMKTAMIVRAELPGMKQEDIELNLQDNVLTLKVEKKKKPKKNRKISSELSAATAVLLVRSHCLRRLKQEAIKATFKDGILEINLPKAEEAHAKKIAISAGS
jgi:HSP20 family protein